ncbi:hypothetical protein Vlu01_46920 [Micromonospora lutea]|uniref:Uncharacterized protein n=1 Tax=Micromonospora lutea TaxID=419825 RepID=A0ABQ4J1J9_9ACTN|nr:hypothetical protein Vlu01_46920 [Micromonospora lutea]
MCLARRTEVVLHAQVQFNSVPTEPATTAGREGRWLGQFGEVEEADMEGARQVLRAPGAGELDVVDHEDTSRTHRRIGLRE